MEIKAEGQNRVMPIKIPPGLPRRNFFREIESPLLGPASDRFSRILNLHRLRYQSANASCRVSGLAVQISPGQPFGIFFRWIDRLLVELQSCIIPSKHMHQNGNKSPGAE